MTFKNIALLFAFTLSIGQMAAQQMVKPIEMGTLPLQVDESSGLAAASETSLWTHNDRGGKAEIFEVEVRGELIRKVRLLGVEPRDMEDMAQDNDGNLYIADTGNNGKDRLKLRVYSFNVADIVNDTVRPAVTEFVLPDRGLEDKCHYDIEAITCSRGRLFFFTKDRCDKKDNNLMIYSIPKETGLYTAKKEGEFFWEDPDKNIKVTGADISPDGKKLVLLTNDALHFFFGYSRSEFFNGSYRFIPLDKSKKEAVVHLDDCDLFISEESSKGVPGRLWKLNLCNIDFDY